MTTYQKIAISLPSRVAENARRAVREGRAPSLSAYIAAAVEQKSSREELAALLDEMLAETGGPPTPAEKRWVRYQLAPKRTGKAPPRPASLAPQRARRQKR